MNNEKMQDARKSAKSIVAKKKENGKYLISDKDLFQYRQKLTSALNAKEKYQFLSTMLSIASDVNVEFEFLYDIIEDFETNINLCIAFTNALHREKAGD